jgi:asparagine synthase (glutamine-hydrolysing)
MAGISGHFQPKHPNGAAWTGGPLLAGERAYDPKTMLTSIFHGRLYNRPNDYLSDSSVVLRVFGAEQEAGFARLDGAFVCAVYDHRNNTLTLARDRAGIQRIYYCITQGELWFSDDLAELIEAVPVSRQICSRALCQYFQFLYIPAPLTIYEGINALSPGWCLTYGINGVRMTQYWDPDVALEHAIHDESTCKKLLRETLTESVSSRLKGGDPAGVLLSGGIDSTIVTGIASKLVGKLQTFTIGYQERGYDESESAQVAASFHGTNHHLIILDAKTAISAFDLIVASMPQPFADSSAIPSYIANRFAAEYTSKVLTGDASDQLFAGSSRYTIHYFADLYARIPILIRTRVIEPVIDLLPDTSSLSRKTRKVVASADIDPWERYQIVLSLAFRESELSSLLTRFNDPDSLDPVRELYRKHEGVTDELTRMLYSDLKVSVEGDLLMKMRSMSRLAGTEVHYPMISNNMLDLAFRIPSRYKLRGRSGKLILKDTFSDLIPDRLKNAPKRGFGIPLDVWFRDKSKSFLLEVLDDKLIRSQGIFHPDYVARIKNEHMSKSVNRGAELWALYVFQRWYEVNFGT